MKAGLHHLAIRSPDPERLSGFYADALGLAVTRQGEGWVGRGPERRIVFEAGPAKTLAYAAYAVEDAGQLEALRTRLARSDRQAAASPSPLFGEGAIMVRDPDGNALVFGLPVEDAAAPGGSGGSGASAFPARLQHFVVASRDAARLTEFYQTVLGFQLSDRVLDEEGGLRTAFLRCSEEHHSFAVFQAAEDRFDHHCYEAGDWAHIKDWGDHMASHHVPIVWGPGRHGPGNNLFVFVHDLDGNWVEISAELEVVAPDRPVGDWKHEQRTLNSWGQGLLRS